jgi:hypothetical protein
VPADDLAPVPTLCRFWSPQREQPLGLGELPEVQLWAAKRRLDAARILDLGNLLMIGLEGEGVQGECRRLVFDFERVLVDPHGDLFPGEPIFAKEAPVAEADVTMLVQMARKLCGIQDPREHLVRVGAPQHPAQHVRGAVPPVLAGAMGKVMLMVVMVPPLLCSDCFTRGAGLAPKLWYSQSRSASARKSGRSHTRAALAPLAMESGSVEAPPRTPVALARGAFRVPGVYA